MAYYSRRKIWRNFKVSCWRKMTSHIFCRFAFLQYGLSRLEVLSCLLQFGSIRGKWTAWSAANKTGGRHALLAWNGECFACKKAIDVVVVENYVRSIFENYLYYFLLFVSQTCIIVCWGISRTTAQKPQISSLIFKFGYMSTSKEWI